MGNNLQKPYDETAMSVRNCQCTETQSPNPKRKLEDVTTDDMLKELSERGVYPAYKLIEDVSTSALVKELSVRDHPLIKHIKAATLSDLFEEIESRKIKITENEKYQKGRADTWFRLACAERTAHEATLAKLNMTTDKLKAANKRKNDETKFYFTRSKKTKR